MADFALFNRLGMSVKRIDFVGGVHTVEPPEEIQPNTTLTWQSEDTGSVTYQVASEGSERGAPRRFTLEWAFTASGTPTCRSHDVARGLKITVEQRSDGARFTVVRKRARRIPPPAPRLGGALSRLAPLPVVVSAVVIMALLAGSAAVLANPLKWTLPNLHVQGHTGTTATSTLPRLAMSPTQTTAVACSDSTVAYPTITLSNTGGQTLNWHASATAAGASVNPSSGSLGAGQSATLQVEQTGPAKAATNVQITSNGGNATVQFACVPPTLGNLAVSPSALGLGNYCGDSFSGVSIRLSNTGKGPLTWSKAGGPGASLSPSSGTLNAGQSASIGVSGTKANGSFGIAWQSGGTGTTYAVTVSTSCNNPPPVPPPSGSPPHGNLAVNPTALALGNYCGQAFGGVSITLSDTGNGPLTWSQTGGSGLSLSPSSGTLNAGQSASVGVSGTKANGSFGIAWQASGGGNTNTVTVSASCVNPPPPHGNLAVNPTTLGLGNYCGDSFGGVSITLSDTGNGPLTWSQAGGSGFTLSPPSGALNPGQSVPVGVSGTKANTSFQINWQDGGQGPTSTVTVSTSCNNPPPPPMLTVNPTRVGLNGFCDPTATVNLGNSGGQTLNWSSSTANGASVSPTSGSIAPGQTIQVTVSWAPIDPTSDGYVYITSNGGNGTIDINGPCPG